MDPVASPSCLRFYPSTRASCVPSARTRRYQRPQAEDASLGPVFFPKLSDLPVRSWPSHRPEKLSSYFIFNLEKPPGTADGSPSRTPRGDLWPSCLSLSARLRAYPCRPLPPSLLLLSAPPSSPFHPTRQATRPFSRLPVAQLVESLLTCSSVHLRISPDF
jgi:hypothetical protein